MAKLFRAVMPCLTAEIVYRTKKTEQGKKRVITQDERFDKIESVIAKLEKSGLKVFVSDPVVARYRYYLDYERGYYRDNKTGEWVPSIGKPIYKEIETQCIVIEAMPPGHTETLQCSYCGEKLLVEFPDSFPFNFLTIKESFLNMHRLCVQQKRRSRGAII